jgi:hypothetical protein
MGAINRTHPGIRAYKGETLREFSNKYNGPNSPQYDMKAAQYDRVYQKLRAAGKITPEQYTAAMDPKVKEQFLKGVKRGDKIRGFNRGFARNVRRLDHALDAPVRWMDKLVSKANKGAIPKSKWYRYGAKGTVRGLTRGGLGAAIGAGAGWLTDKLI